MNVNLNAYAGKIDEQEHLKMVLHRTKVCNL